MNWLSFSYYLFISVSVLIFWSECNVTVARLFFICSCQVDYLREGGEVEEGSRRIVSLS